MTEPLTTDAWPIPLDDPYPALAEMRAQRPVHYLAELDCYLVVAHAEAKAVLSGAQWSSDPRSRPGFANRLSPPIGAGELISKSVLFSDEPDHRRLRRALGGQLSPNAVELLRPRIRSIVQAALVGLSDSGLDIMEHLAYPVPLAVICELLDVGTGAAQLIKDETPKMIAMLDPLAGPEELEVGAAAAFGVMLELVPLVADRQSQPSDDFLSELVSSTATRGGLESDEAIMMSLLLLAAGHETTANLIGNAVVCLHDHPDQTRWLRMHPEHLMPATDELLRYESPVQIASRVAKSTVIFDDVQLSPGDRVLVHLGAANRDPAVFIDPDRLDLARAGQGHIGFGHGVHFCAGASLARAEAQEVLMQLLERGAPLEERVLKMERGTSPTFRRIESLRLLAG